MSQQVKARPCQPCKFLAVWCSVKPKGQKGKEKVVQMLSIDFTVPSSNEKGTPIPDLLPQPDAVDGPKSLFGLWLVSSGEGTGDLGWMAWLGSLYSPTWQGGDPQLVGASSPSPGRTQAAFVCASCLWSTRVAMQAEVGSPKQVCMVAPALEKNAYGH